jgi:hypothetical protein
MSYLLFMDESGHDHKSMPLEVRGGVAIELSKLWAFQKDWRALEFRCFGTQLSEFGKEPKGAKLLDKKVFRWASQSNQVVSNAVSQEARSFLEAGRLKVSPSASNMKAYGLACLQMVDGIFGLLRKYDVKIFATSIPRGITDRQNTMKETHLRKDYAFLIERYYYFLEANNRDGMLVLDETDRSDDRRFIGRIGRYFALTKKGQARAKRVFPIPFFIASDMSIGVQAADVILYCINWGFRKDYRLNGFEVRKEIQERYEMLIANLQWIGSTHGATDQKASRSIVHIPDPYTFRGDRKP